ISIIGTQARPLADFDHVLAVCARPGSAPEDLLVVAVPGGGTVPELFVLTPTTNSAPIVPNLDLRGLLPSEDRGSYVINLPSTITDPNGDAVTLTLTSAGTYGTGSISHGPDGNGPTQFFY